MLVEILRDNQIDSLRLAVCLEEFFTLYAQDGLLKIAFVRLAMFLEPMNTTTDSAR